MDTLKQPAMIVSGINSIGLIASVIYFYKKNAALQEELNRIDEDLQKNMQNIGQVANGAGQNHQQLEGIKIYLQKLQKINKKRNNSFEDLKTLVETLVDEVEGLNDALQNVQEVLVNKCDYKGDLLQKNRRNNKKKVAFALKAKKKEDSSSDSEESSSESDDDEKKSKKKKGKKGKEKAGKKSKRKEDDSEESDEDIESAIAAVRGAKK